ncbi:hypothetical protein GCM10010411_75250 [Actinomadura fulvescens]|uniref:Uncharacterized protein n=1 Tax=Actinomadura fulvescens TaxID=46160 RepID=A0ABN3QIH5_9ACTN
MRFSDNAGPGGDRGTDMSFSPLEQRMMRRALTGEPITVAGRQLAAHANDQPLIPAAQPHQAAFETSLLITWGFCDYSHWDETAAEGKARQTRYPPFGMRYLIPKASALEISVHPYLLPQFIDVVLPKIEPGGDEIYGMPGLRANVQERSVVLHRPHLAGLIRVLVTKDRWNTAAKLALEGVDRQRTPWLTDPDAWHPMEAAHHQRYAHLRDFGADGNQFLSGLLRRCHALNSSSHTPYWHLWSNRHSVQLEWRGGATHQTVLERLLHPQCGLDATLEDPSAACRCDDTSDYDNQCYSVPILSPSGISLNLRRQRPYRAEKRALASRLRRLRPSR